MATFSSFLDKNREINMGKGGKKGGHHRPERSPDRSRSRRDRSPVQDRSRGDVSPLNNANIKPLPSTSFSLVPSLLAFVCFTNHILRYSSIDRCANCRMQIIYAEICVCKCKFLAIYVLLNKLANTS